MYASSEYQKIAKRNIEYIDLLNKNHDNKISDLNKIFKKATRLEAEFWQMSMK